MRSRLWTLILRELPFPFREIGMEVVRIITWIDKSAARLWLGLTRSPAWYVVTLAGTAAFALTLMLFFTFGAGDQRTVVEIASRKMGAAETRESLEKAGDWAAQDKWRLAHMFVDHRPPRRHAVRQLDTRLVDDFPAFARVPGQRGFERRAQFNPRFNPKADQVQVTNLTLPDPEVRLELSPPRVAEEPKRLVYGQYVREPGSDFRPVGLASYRSRDSRLLVQAEWSQGVECDTEPLVRRPTRRIIPVPEPAWDELPPLPDVADASHPDLSFEMSLLREFLPPTGEFPPRSRFESVSAVSEFPESLELNRSPFLVGEPSPWSRTPNDRPENSEPVESYADRVGPDEALPPIDDLDDDPELITVPSFTEVALRLELRAPESTVAGRVNQSALILRNDSVRDIPLVSVREPLGTLETVTDAIPPARVDQFDNVLERRLQNLEPGKDQRLELVWRAETEGQRTHSAIVTVRTAVGATTEVVAPVADQPMPSVAPEPIPLQEPEPEPRIEPFIEPEPLIEPKPAIQPKRVPEANPGLSIDVQSLPRATVDDQVEIGIIVRNTGDVPLHDVRVMAQLPEQLKHRRGSEVEFTIEELPVDGAERAVLRLLAHSTGRAACLIQVAAQEPAEARSRAVIDVNARPEPPAPKVSRTKPAPANPPRPAPAPKRPTPVAAPAVNCCCPIAICEPWFIP